MRIEGSGPTQCAVFLVRADQSKTARHSLDPSYQPRSLSANYHERCGASAVPGESFGKLYALFMACHGLQSSIGTCALEKQAQQNHEQNMRNVSAAMRNHILSAQVVREALIVASVRRVVYHPISIKVAFCERCGGLLNTSSSLKLMKVREPDHGHSTRFWQSKSHVEVMRIGRMIATVAI